MNIANDMRDRLPAELVELVATAGRLAGERAEELYLVGGAVRDLFLRRPNLDLDLVLEGNAPSLARRLARLGYDRVITHPRFGTATVHRGSFAIDIVTARSETYAAPGALPSVTPGSIHDDLFRRDFTINAIAARLNASRFGEIVDPYGGEAHLKQGTIRVLHERSFTDDPTRIWRAIRYEQRLGFSIHADTELLLRRDTALMGRVSGDRHRHELDRILQEEQPERPLQRADELGALRYLSPSLRGNGWLAERFERARRANVEATRDGVLYLTLLAWRLDGGAIDSFVSRLNFGRQAARALRDIPSLKKTLSLLEAEAMAPSHIYRLLEHHNPRTILAAALATESEPVQQRLALYLSNLRFVETSLSGEDLKRLGVPQGRKLGSMLRALRDARLDGDVTDRNSEQDLVRRWLAQSRRRGHRLG